jgi:hypothetical protein
MKRFIIFCVLALVVFLSFSCMSKIPPHIKYVSTKKFDAKPMGCNIKILETALDDKTMIPIAEIIVYSESNRVIGDVQTKERNAADKEISDIACQQGADGVANMVYLKYSANGISFKYIK